MGTLHEATVKQSRNKPAAAHASGRGGLAQQIR